MEHIKTIETKNLCDSAKNGGCGECQTSCQSACKTSCGIANQKCEKYSGAYLKTVNTPKQRVLSRSAAPFSLKIQQVFLRKNGLHSGKIPRCWAYFQFFR